MYQQQRRVTEALVRTLMAILWICNVDASSACPNVQEALVFAASQGSRRKGSEIGEM